MSIIDTQLLIKNMPALLKGAVITLEIAALSCSIGLVFGTILGSPKAVNISFYAYWLVYIPL